MKKHLPSASILLALLLVLCFHAFAVDDKQSPAPVGSGSSVSEESLTVQADSKPVYAALKTDVSEQIPSTPVLSVNGILLPDTTALVQEENTTYVGIEPVVKALFPAAVCSTTDGCLNISADGLALQANFGTVYFSVNDRVLYVPDTVRCESGQNMVPVRVLADALGCQVDWNSETNLISLTQVGPVSLSAYYPPDDLYWLARVIYAEAGNQPLNGRIAVGTVILNRVVSDRFPDTIQGVIFAPGQFSTVSAGTIYHNPDETSVLAAKLCLEGAREAGESLYFNATYLTSWADHSRTYICTIGGHNFYA